MLGNFVPGLVAEAYKSQFSLPFLIATGSNRRSTVRILSEYDTRSSDAYTFFI